MLAANNMTAYFVGWLTRDDGYPRKPDPAVFEAILETHHLKREETITVGDREIDILAGRAAGVATCFFGLEPKAIDADLIISDFRDLYQFLVSENS